MARLNLFLLGLPRVELDGVSIDLDTRKAVALLAYLAVTKRSHSREALAALLWPDATEARLALRRTLSSLNKALPGRWLQADRNAIGLRSDADLWVDLDEFQEQLDACRAHRHRPDEACPTCLSSSTRAAALYRDNFLAGFSLRDSSSFDDWQFYQAESFRRDLTEILENLVCRHRNQQEFEPAVNYARRWLALDPLNEVAHRQLMQLYAWMGQTTAALQQYQKCVQILARELGVAPVEETAKLYEAIKENRLPSPTDAPVSYPTPGSGDWRDARISEAAPTTRQPAYPIVGRSAESAVLRRVYDDIVADGHFIVLEGEAGVGKTRLAETLLEYARAAGAAVITARCYEGQDSLAYAPFIEGLRATLGPQTTRHSSGCANWLAKLPAPWLCEAMRLLPELAGLNLETSDAPPLNHPAAQTHFLEGISQLVLAASHGARPGIVFLDDLHWADAASLELLAYLVRRLRGRPICILATWRSEDLPPDHQLRHLLAEVQRTGQATILALRRLDRIAVNDLVQAANLAGGHPSGQPPESLPELEDLAVYLYRETEGLPFLLVSYLEALTRERSTAYPGGWSNDRSGDWSLPSDAQDFLRSRLKGVSETGWQVLNAAAVVGRSFDFETVRDVCCRSDEEMVAALEELIRRGLIEEVSGSTAVLAAASGRELSYHFTHEKLRALVYTEMSLARQQLLHRRVAESLVPRASNKRPNNRALARLVSNHYPMAGHNSPAIGVSHLAELPTHELPANTEVLARFHSTRAPRHSDKTNLTEIHRKRLRDLSAGG